MRRLAIQFAALAFTACSLTARAARESAGTIKHAKPHTSNPAPRYPEMLKSAGLEGSVTVQIAVDTNGIVKNASFPTGPAANDLFKSSVRVSVSKWQFDPATKKGRKIADTVRMEFVFQLPMKVMWYSPPDTMLYTARPGERWRRDVNNLGDFRDTSPVPLSTETQESVSLAVIDTVLSQIVQTIPFRAPILACISYQRNNVKTAPTAKQMSNFTRRHVALFDFTKCPTSYAEVVGQPYAGGIIPPDSTGKPGGHLVIGTLVSRGENHIRMDASFTTQGSNAQRLFFNCFAEPIARKSSRWAVTCTYLRELHQTGDLRG